MQKIRLLALATTATMLLAMASCNKDDDKNQDNNQKLENAVSNEERQSIVSEITNTTLDALQASKEQGKPAELTITDNIKSEDLKTISQEIEKRGNLDVVLEVLGFFNFIEKKINIFCGIFAF